jgi:protein SMG6
MCYDSRLANRFSILVPISYPTVLLTFLSIVLKHRRTLDVLERSIPWEELGAFFATVPSKIVISQGLMSEPGKSNSRRNVEQWAMLTSGRAPSLVEDWCLRGMEWVGHKAYEHGFWKSGEERKVELEVLETTEGGQLTDDDGEEHSQKSSSTIDLIRRWVRISRCAVNISGAVDGLTWMMAPETRRLWANKLRRS